MTELWLHGSCYYFEKDNVHNLTFAVNDKTSEMCYNQSGKASLLLYICNGGAGYEYKKISSKLLAAFTGAAVFVSAYAPTFASAAEGKTQYISELFL